MLICPNCGKYMTFKIVYVSGNPTVIYECDCGYSSSNITSINDTKTYIDTDMVDTVTNYTKNTNYGGIKL